MNKQSYRLHRHEIVKIILKRMDYTMQQFADDAKVSITTIFNWIRKPESCRYESQIETVFLRIVEKSRAIPVKKARAILRNSELSFGISQSEYCRVMMDRHKLTVDSIARQTGIDRNQVFFWTQGKKESTQDAEVLKEYFTNAVQPSAEHLCL